MKRKAEENESLLDNHLIQPEPPKRKKDNQYYNAAIRSYYTAVQKHNNQVIDSIKEQCDENIELNKINLKHMQYDLENKKIELESKKIELESKKMELEREKLALKKEERFTEISYKRATAEVNIMNATAEDLQTGLQAVEKLVSLRRIRLDQFAMNREEQEIKALEENEENFESGRFAYHS